MKTFSKGKGFNTLFLAIMLILTCGLLMAFKIKTDNIKREKIPGASVIYLPKAKYLKYATFGYDEILADLIYIWAVQYYSNYSIFNRFQYLDHIFEVIAELDPNYVDPYDIGAMIAVYEAKDMALAFNILDRGLEKNPDEWLFPFMAGHYAQRFIKDYKIAQDYYKKAMEIEGAPAQTRRLYANAVFMTNDYQTALKEWLEIFETAEDKRTKKIASNHIYRTKAAIDIQAISGAIEKYKEKYNRNPMDLSQLVKAGFLVSLPKVLDRKDYLYDSQTGEVKAPTIPWKR
jgi:tetratricopeptide (TPR) repeat protein